MQLELRNHPAQARHPITREPLYDKDNQPVPLIKDQKAIFMDGFMVGYCGVEAGQHINLTVAVPTAVAEAIVAFVEREVGLPKAINIPPVWVDESVGDDDEEE